MLEFPMPFCSFNDIIWEPKQETPCISFLTWCLETLYFLLKLNQTLSTIQPINANLLQSYSPFQCKNKFTKRIVKRC